MAAACPSPQPSDTSSQDSPARLSVPQDSPARLSVPQDSPARLSVPQDSPPRLSVRQMIIKRHKFNLTLECIRLRTSDGARSWVVETNPDQGLYMTEGDGTKRRQVAEDDWWYSGLCEGAQPNEFFCTALAIEQKRYLEKYVCAYRLKETGKATLLRKTNLLGVGSPVGLAFHSDSGRLAVADRENSKLIILSAKDLKVARTVEGWTKKKTMGGKQFMSSPRYLSWHPDGQDIYIGSRGEFPVPSTVMRLHLGESPPRVVWKVRVEGIWNLRYLHGLVFVFPESAKKGQWVLAVLSARNGQTVRTLACGPCPAGLWEDNPGQLTCACYPREKYPARKPL